MKKLILFPCLLFLLFLFMLAQNSGGREQADVIRELSKPAHPSIFMSREDFYRYLGEQAAINSETADTESRIICGVVPHHLVASRLIVQFWDMLARQEPEVIILAGPNHYNLGGKVITGLYDWQTPEGLVKTEAQIVGTLLDKGLAVCDEEVLSKEHSIGGLLPFIRHFMPQARVVPLIFHHDVSLQEIDALLAALKPYLDRGAVLAASVDFSHYLTRREAQDKDELTLRVMRQFDYTTLFKLGNDHLDSPASLTLAFRYAQIRDFMEFDILGHSNSGIILKNDMMETTSYFTLVFKEK